jgi:hypothetical protein
LICGLLNDKSRVLQAMITAMRALALKLFGSFSFAGAALVRFARQMQCEGRYPSTYSVSARAVSCVLCTLTPDSPLKLLQEELYEKMKGMTKEVTAYFVLKRGRVKELTSLQWHF